MKKIVFLRGFHIAPEPRLEKAAAWLHESYKDAEIIALGWDRDSSMPQNEKKEFIFIERMQGFGQYGGGFRKNIIGLILFQFWLLYKLIKIKADIIHACDLDVAIPALVISRICRCKLVYDIYDFYSDNRNLGIWDKPVRRLEQYVARSADLTIICDERRMCQLGNNSMNHVIVVYNTPDDVMDGEAYIADEEYKYLISYVGVLIPNRHILEAINCTVDILHEGFGCAGFGILEKDVKEIADKNDKLVFYGKVDYKTAIEIEKNSYAIIAMYNPAIINNRYAAPNKLCEAMMLGKPLITSRNTLCGDLVEQEKIGLAIDYDNLDELRKAIKYIKEHHEEAKRMGDRARALYDRKYSAKIAKKILCGSYDDFMADKRK